MLLSALNDLDVWFAETFSIDYDADSHYLFTGTPHFPLIGVTLYIIMLVGLPKFLIKFKLSVSEKTLKYAMAAWNLFLALFSIVCFIGILLPWGRAVNHFGLFSVYCDAQRKIFPGKQGILYWAYMFALSKYAELLDTFWLILKKPTRPVMFLHWYHHITVLLFTWFAEYAFFSVGFIFIFMNAFVHSLMYSYYFVVGLGYSVPTLFSMILTILQISQMFVGIAVNGYYVYLYFTGTQCFCKYPYPIMFGCLVMYGSYLYLFMEFFFKKYFPSEKPSEKPKQN